MPALFDCHITHLDDAKLAELVSEWQQRALRGEGGAPATARALEAEQFRRLCLTSRPALQPATLAPPRVAARTWSLGRFLFGRDLSDRAKPS